VFYSSILIRLIATINDSCLKIYKSGGKTHSPACRKRTSPYGPLDIYVRYRGLWYDAELRDLSLPLPLSSDKIQRTQATRSEAEDVPSINHRC